MGDERSVAGDTAEGISWIEDGIEDCRATGAMLTMPFWLALQGEALHLADRTPEALEAIEKAEALVERSEERWCCAELHRLRAVFLAAICADETKIEDSLCKAIRTAKEQKSSSLATRVEVTYAEYHRSKGNALRGHGLRLPL